MRVLHGFRRSGGHCGFTLIEILSVVVILGLVSAILLPQLGPRDDLKVASAARTLMADITYAQNRAVTVQTKHYIVFDTANKKYDLMVPAGGAVNGAPSIIITHPVTQNPYEMVFGKSPLNTVNLGTVSFDGQTTLAFDELGVPYSYSSAGGLQTLNSGSVTITSGQASMTVTVLPYSGEVKVQ